MRVEQLQTPALILEKKIFERNIQAMQTLLRDKTLELRPHYKSHKCAAIARTQIQNGAKGMTCAKLSEAEDLADAGIEDILIANQITDPQKIRRAADLAGVCRLTVCVDNEENIQALSRAAENAGTVIHCLIEYEIGMERCGVTAPEQVLALAKCIADLPNLHFAGIQAYAGHASHMTELSDRQKVTADNSQRLKALLQQLQEAGYPAQILSGGSTGTCRIKAEEGLYTELQAGSYLFMDATYATLGLPFRQSLFLLTTVVSRREGLTVVDAGVKTCGVDQGMPVVEDGTVEQIVASEEHFQLHGLSLDVKVGDKLRLIPGHCCSTVNLHDRIYLVEDGKVVDRIAITGRGFGK